MSLLVTTVKSELATPLDWFAVLNEEFNFYHDVAADDLHHMTDYYYTEKHDGLVQNWYGTVWCSPPWVEGGLYAWVRKGYTESLKVYCTRVVMLLPVQSTMRWWHEFVLHSREIRFLTGTLDFVPFRHDLFGFTVEPSCLVVFGPTAEYPKMTSYPHKVIS